MFKVAVVFIALSFFLPFVSASEKSVTNMPPVWIETPTEQYPERTYMTAVGEGFSQKEA